MHAPGASLVDGAAARATLRSLLTEQLRAVLEQRSVRIAVVGTMLVAASAFSLIPTDLVADAGWMFVVPVAISAITGGLKEGLMVSLFAAALEVLFATARLSHFDQALIVGVFTSRFVLYAIIAAVLGAFAEAHYSVQSNLRRLATIDPLTKVANVAYFYDEMGLLETMSSRFAVLLLDVDDLKKLNDRYGHQTGSGAIQAVATVLRRVVRGTDCVARYGGDEFVVILRDADRAGAQIVANRVREMLGEELLPGAPDERVSVSVGVALSGEDGLTSEELLAAADRAMYEDKRARKARPASVA